MSPPQNPHIFLSGGTGLIGATYLTELLRHSSKPRRITVLSRSKDKAGPIENLSTSDTTVEALIGSFDDYDLLTEAAYHAEITIEAGDSDNPELVDALLKGMKRRKEEGKRSTFIHVSGTGTLADDARGAFKSDTIYTDASPEGSKIVNINDLPETAFHRKIDIAICEADKQGICESYLIFPGTVWGVGKGVTGELHSKQIPQQVESSMDRGRAGMVGKGLNVWAHVHIEDLATHFVLIYNTALQSGPHGYEGNYLAVAGEYQLLEATKWISRTMHEQGWTKHSEPDSFTEDELMKYYGSLIKIGGSQYYSGTNSRGISANAERLGWKPKHADVSKFYEDYVVSETKRIGAGFQAEK